MFVPVAAGDTLSGIAAAHGESLASVEAANPNFTDPNLIVVGETVVVPTGGSYAQWTPQTPSPSSSQSSSSSSSSSPSSSGSVDSSGLDDIPGVPSSFVSCVAFRESTDGTNPASVHGGVPDYYGIIPSSGHDVYGSSLATQKATFAQLYQEDGSQPWAPSDGC